MTVETRWGVSAGGGGAGAAGAGGAVELARAAFEGGDHAAHRLAEQDLDDLLQYSRLEFKIDEEVDAAAAGHRRERPVIVEIAERSLGIGHVDAPRRVEGDP